MKKLEIFVSFLSRICDITYFLFPYILSKDDGRISVNVTSDNLIFIANSSL